MSHRELSCEQKYKDRNESNMKQVAVTVNLYMVCESSKQKSAFSFSMDLGNVGYVLAQSLCAQINTQEKPMS